MAELKRSISVLSLKKGELEKERDKLMDFFCPGANNLESAQQQQEEEDSYPAMSAAEQIIYGKMEVKRAEMEVLALAEWGSSHKKANQKLRRQVRKSFDVCCVLTSAAAAAVICFGLFFPL